MKNLFNVIVVVLAVVISFSFYYGFMGRASGFNKDHEPITMVATIYTGGPLVALLLTFIVLAITFVIERFLSISKAAGKGNPEQFMHKLIGLLEKNEVDSALSACDTQRGSLANVMRSAIIRFKDVSNNSGLNESQKIAEVQRAIDESMNLETPLLEKNLVMLSTIASISTMVGLLGTTLGMIRSFQALGVKGGAVTANALSIGISEALYNTAGGLIGAVICIVAYNFFTTKVDNFVYILDESILSITQLFTIKVKS